MNRRTWFKLMGAGAASLALPATAAKASGELFIVIHAAGGWDVTLWSDPRNERKGLVEPASTDNTDSGPLTHWKAQTLDDDTDTFTILDDGRFRLGPGIGDLWDLRDRLTIVNGLAMNTVSHPDGTAYSATGRHLAGGRAPASSVDVALANELGTAQLLPVVSVQFPSSFVGEHLDRRAIPLRVASAGTIAKSLARSDAYLSGDDRDAIAAVLGDEASDLAKHSTYPETYERLKSQLDSQPTLIGDKLQAAFTPKALMDAYPSLPYKARFQAQGALAAAFAIESMKRDLVRCVAFSLGGLDTHNANYKQHAHTQQELFGVIASMLKILDDSKLSDRTHILVVSDFCRTPQINLAGGRDHYPNNSALIISPKFKPGMFGKTDAEQLLPADAGIGRPLTPPDVLATFLQAFGIDPRRYLRDGDVIKDMLA
jgi:hypothetical protein